MAAIGRITPTLLALPLAFHLLWDLALPQTGAFRFNPHESVDGVRAEEIVTEALDRVLQASSRPEPARVPARLVQRAPSAVRRPEAVPRAVVPVTRRDVSPGATSPRSPDDH